MPNSKHREVPEAYRRAFRRETHVLASRPELVWQLLHNRLQWEGELVEQRLARERERRAVAGTVWFRLWSPFPESRALIGALAGGTAHPALGQLTFTPDGSHLLTGEDGVLTFWDPATGMALRTVKLGSEHRPGWRTRARRLARHAHPGPAVTTQGCVVSPDGSFVVSATPEALKLWDLERGTELCTLEGGDPAQDPMEHLSDNAGWLALALTEEPISPACAVSPDGSFVAGRGSDGAVRIWDAATGTVLPAHRPHHRRARLDDGP